MPSGKLESLDALRGVLAIVVAFAHAWQMLVVPAWGAADADGQQVQAWLGVAAKLAVFTFFTLSGYVIALTVSRNVARHGSFRPGEFFGARAWRILPPLLAVLAITFVLERLMAIGGIAAPADLTLTRTEFSQDWFATAKCLASACGTGTLVLNVNGPLWSLQAEIQLYVISGLLVWLWHDRKRRLWLGFGLAGYLLLGFRPLENGVLTLQLPSFVAFGIGWLMQVHGPRMSRISLASCAAAGAAGCAAALLLTSADEFARLDGGVAVSAAFACFALAAAAVIQLLAGRFATCRFGRIGGFSYTLYILHYPVLLAFSLLLFSAAPSFASAYALPIGLVATLAVMAMADALARWVEKPQLLKHRTLELLRSVQARRATARTPSITRA